jgi:anti-sigma B factor antagonist
MNIQSNEKDGVLIIQVDGEININTSPELKKSFDQVSASRVVINMEKVGYIDSSGLATLVELLKKLRNKSGALYLTHVSDKVKSLFEITKLDKLFGIYATDDEVFKSLS